MVTNGRIAVHHLIADHATDRKKLCLGSKH